MKFFTLGTFLIASLFMSVSASSNAQDCSRYTKPSLCITAGCSWVAGQCVNPGRNFNSAVEEESTNASLVNVNDGSFDELREYLGCTFDEQQCASRAASYGYSRNYAERHYACPNAVKFGCWGIK